MSENSGLRERSIEEELRDWPESTYSDVVIAAAGEENTDPQVSTTIEIIMAWIKMGGGVICLVFSGMVFAWFPTMGGVLRGALILLLGLCLLRISRIRFGS